MTINTTPQLMNKLAQALDDRDLDLLDQIDADTADWIESAGEKSARHNLIEAVRTAITQMEYWSE
jgi:predicted transcriptional regulator